MFAHPEYLYLLVFPPVFFLLYILRVRANRRLLSSYMRKECLSRAVGPSSQGRRIFRQGILLTAVLFLILALARPRSQQETEKVEVKGAEVMIVADVSKSMLVEDMGGLSRLDVMKKELNRLISLLSGWRVGLISFSGSASLASPLTLDHSALKLFIKSLSPEGQFVSGTDFAGAFRMAGQALARGSALQPDSSSRALIVASDGEDNEGKALQAVRELRGRKARIFTLGFGSEEGGMIPIYGKSGGRKISYKKDRTGRPVVSRFRAETLKEIARVGGGAFYMADLGGNTAEKIYADIQKTGKDILSYQYQSSYKEGYGYFAFMAFLFGLLYFFPSISLRIFQS